VATMKFRFEILVSLDGNDLMPLNGDQITAVLLPMEAYLKQCVVPVRGQGHNVLDAEDNIIGKWEFVEEDSIDPLPPDRPRPEENFLVTGSQAVQ